MAHQDTVTLGFKAFDVHELLLHFVALRLGYYRQHGIRVSLTDITFIPEEQLDPLTFTVTCGAALLARRKGVRRKVLFVTTDYPMFWMYAQAHVKDLSDLKNARIATYPSAAPPWHFHRSILQKHGFDPDHDVQLEPARDDFARLGLLRSGDVQAAVLSSIFPPARIEPLGFKTLVFFGNEIRLPTTGLVVSDEMILQQPELVKNMLLTLQQSLAAVHDSPLNVVPIIAEFLGDSREIAEQTYPWIDRYFTKKGRANPEALQNALAIANADLSSEHRLSEIDLYDYSFLPE